MSPRHDAMLWWRFARAASGRLFYPFVVLRCVQSLGGTCQALAVMWLLAQVAQGGPIGGQLALLIVCVVATMGLQVVLGHLTTVVKEQVQCHLNREILDVTTDIPTIDYLRSRVTADRLDYLKRETWRTMDTAFAPFDLVVTLANLAFVLVLVVSVQPVLALVPLFGLVRVIGSAASTTRLNRAQGAASPHLRRSDTLVSLATSSNHAMETRTYGAGPLIMGELVGVSRRALAVLVTARRGAAGVELAGRMTFSVVYCAVISLILWRATGMTSSEAASALVLLILLMARIERVSSGLASGGGQLTQLMHFLKELEAFREQSHHGRSAEPAADPAAGLVFESASFTYPGQPRSALDEVTLRVPPGTVVAVVGRNGAGKTTLVELVLGLHHVSGGQLLANGEGAVSASLQNGTRFNFPLRDAVVLDRGTDSGDLDTALWRTLAEAEADALARSLPERDHTVLGALFRGGRDLSGGEWQRVSNAAALFPAAPRTLVLDEPTSAIDPRVEEVTLRSLLAGSRRISAAGGLAFIVSHRLALTREVDLIVVLDGGRVIEVGSHEELVSLGGTYARMYARQSALYS